VAFKPSKYFSGFPDAAPPSCAPHMLKCLVSTWTPLHLKDQKTCSRESRHDLNCLISLCYYNLSSYWKMTRRFKELKLQPSDVFSNMELTLRYTPGGLKRILLKRPYQDQPRGRLRSVALMYIFAVFRLAVLIPISPSSHHVSISTSRALYRCTQAALSWFRHLPSIPSFHRRRHRCSHECFRGFFGQQINRSYNPLFPST
jgi:hypothetical protein